MDAGLRNHQHATTEIVNKWCMLPILIHIQMAHKIDKSLVDVAKDANVHRAVLYAMRHHVYSHCNVNLPVHPCMVKVYKFPSKAAYLASDEYQIIPASLYLSKIFNACLTMFYHDDITSVKPRAQLQ